MNNKFVGLLTEDNLDVVTTIMSTVDLPEKGKLNLIETMCNIVYCHQDYFNKLTLDEKIKSITMVALTFDILLDKEINPYAAKQIGLGIMAYNNNIYIADTSLNECNYYDVLNKCCMVQRMDVIESTIALEVE